MSNNEKESNMRRSIATLLLTLMLVTLAGACSSEADVASQNVSTAADQFEVYRRVVFFNGITDTYLLTIEGLCSLGNHDEDRELSVTCKVGPSEYKKHFLGLSDNVSYFVEHLQATTVSAYHYRVIFRPTIIIPDVDLELP